MNRIQIKPATPNDSQILSQVHLEAYRTAYHGIIPDTYLNQLNLTDINQQYQTFLATGHEQTALLLTDETALGYITIRPCPDQDLDTSYGEILNLYLLQSSTKKGYGKILINWGLEQLQASGYCYAVLWTLIANTNARSFYEHLGFVADGARRTITRGITLEQLRYQLIIP